MTSKFILVLCCLVSIFSHTYATEEGQAKYNYEAVKKIVIQSNGRIKPLDTYAREIVRYFTDSDYFSSYKDNQTGLTVTVFEDAEPISILFSIAFKEPEYAGEKFIKLDNAEVKQFLGLPEQQLYFSYLELSNVGQRISDKAESIFAQEKKSESQFERAIAELYNRYYTFRLIGEEKALRIVPIPITVPMPLGDRQDWLSISYIEDYLNSRLSPNSRSIKAVSEQLNKFPKEQLKSIVDTYNDMKIAFIENTPDRFNKASIKLTNELSTINPSVYPNVDIIETEIRFNGLSPFSKAIWLYLSAFIFFICAVITKNKYVYLFSMVVILGGFALHLYGLILRGLIAERVPFSNMYESMILLSLLIITTALVFEIIYRNAIFGIVSSLLCIVGLLSAQSVFASSIEISPLVPALKSNWMTIHVPCLINGYVCGIIMMGLGHIYIFTYIFSPNRIDELQRLDTFMYRILQTSLFFLITGTCLGAVWGGEAWGRYWGWDMKENWALITILTYLAILHSRIAKYIKGLGTAIGSLVGFAIVFLTYYGVNFMFGKGLHSYGRGAVTGNAIISVFFILELVIIIFSIATYIARSKQYAYERSQNLS